ncbi:hypothetical protein BMF94_6405 [Rhodotorula taiwanensis]|uniref:Uncharacterized protein n=1 Tax=Rhodotorula taiwanensis TaxID=741276 RepID=A0A2S5B1H3_9BASI|nr:hypothetical protein BMF94_6405 [Rhodotorula taiwanensis]
MNDRPSHPLLDRLEAKHSPPSLKETSLVMLRLHWPAVRDVGDAPFSLLKSLLPHSAADQLAEIEDNSPHIAPHTNGAERCADSGDSTMRESYELTFSAPWRPTGIWRELCVHEFIEVRKAVEDGRISKKEEPKSWREQYSLEEVKREEKMQAIVSKLRGKNDEYKYGRATTKEVDWRVEKKRRSNAASYTARPKTLMEKARHNSKAIKSMYAPRRRSTKPPAPAPCSQPSQRAVSLLPSAAGLLPPARLSAPGLASPKKRVAITTEPAPAATGLATTTTKKRSIPDSPPAGVASVKRAKTVLSPPPPRSRASPAQPPPPPSPAPIPPSPSRAQLFKPYAPGAVPSAAAAGPPKPVPRGIFMPKRR